MIKIFISWSGTLSKELGEVVKKWIPGVLQNVKPYFTPDDVEKGTRWASEISRELQESQVGIIILTRENLSSPWILFESGALSKQLEKARICPVLFGLENTDLVGPLVQFQATCFNKEDFYKLIKTINAACAEQKLDDTVLTEVYEMWWPKLENAIGTILKKGRERPDGALRTERELIEEILSLTRLSTTRRNEHITNEISPLSVQELRRTYTRLVEAIDTQDFDTVSSLVRRLRRPIENIVAVTGFMSRPRIERESVIVEPKTGHADIGLDLLEDDQKP